MGCGGSKSAAKSSSPTSRGASKDKGANNKPGNGESRPILGKYKLMQGKEDFLGKGASSICMRGKDMETGQIVAIKMYKEQQNGSGKVKDVTLQKYKRQIAVLKELQEPFVIPEEQTLWNKELQGVKPGNLFMQLIDYSKDEKGEPGPDPHDGMLYVVTELGQYSLKDFLADRREKQKPFSRETVRDLSKRIMLSMAGLHAKGFVHGDMKPENMMVFDGRLKVIDVDGCVRKGTKVSVNDSSISFSPCYCAPEWASFMIKDTEDTICANPSLDVWSVGMTLCEFVTLDAVWKPQYANFMRNASSLREAGFLFLDWLSEICRPPLPKAVERFDPGFVDLLTKWLLVCDPKNRMSCAQALSNPYLAEGGWAKYSDAAKGAKPATSEEAEAVPEATPARIERVRQEDDSVLAPLHKGTLWKLSANSNPKEEQSWIKRDMWLAHNQSLCYFSVKENKRLVLVDGGRMASAKIQTVSDVYKKNAFELALSCDEGEAGEKVVLASDSPEESEEWVKMLQKTNNIDVMATFHLGGKMAEELAAFRLAVRNRRLKVQGDTDGFEPAFKAKLWKLKAGGESMKEEHWFLREMWVSKNGSLVYWSPKEERELVYYTVQDVAKAQIELLPDGSQFKPYAFSVILEPTDGVEYDPGAFAAESEEMRDQWVSEMRKCMIGSPPLL